MSDNIKYMIIGAGGTGGAVGSYLARAGKEVTFIARGRHLEAMREEGLHVIKPAEEFTVSGFRAFNEAEFLNGISGNKGSDSLMPDVIFVCVKGYSLDDIIPFVRKAAAGGAIVIPILNLYGTGSRMQSDLDGIMVTDGCIYVASEIKEPGVILMKGEILRVVFGLRSSDRCKTAQYERLFGRIRDDLTEAQIDCIVSDNIERDALRKFSYVSPQGACGLYHGVSTGAIQRQGKERDTFAGLVHEVQMLAEAMGIDFGEDIVASNLAILDALEPSMTTSLQRDIAQGKASEIDGLIFNVVKLAGEYDIKLPLYEKIAADLKIKMNHQNE